MDLLDLIILGLATWRLSSLLTNDNEEGPFGLLIRTREFGRKITSAFDCLWCMSIWIGLVIILLYWAIPDYTIWICLPLALSAIAIGWERVNG